MAAAIGDLPGWFDPASPPPAPDDYLAQEMDQSRWLNTATLGYYITFRWETEQRAGGNPSSNVGVDYREQLQRSINRDEVYSLYQTAGRDLEADLQVLSDAPRVQADPTATNYLNVFVFDGRPQIPVITQHTVGDGRRTGSV